MKKSFNGWIARDADGDLYVGVKKPRDHCGIWVEFGDYIQIEKSEFPGIICKNSPQKVTITIEDADELYKEEYHVDGCLSPIIADLPCIVGTCKGHPNQHYYIFQWRNFTTLVKEGDTIARKENGDWVVLSEFKAED